MLAVISVSRRPSRQPTLQLTLISLSIYQLLQRSLLLFKSRENVCPIQLPSLTQLTLYSLCSIVIDLVRVMILVSMRQLKAFTSLNARKRTLEKIEQSAPVPEGVTLSLFRSVRPDPSFLVCTFILFLACLRLKSCVRRRLKCRRVLR